MKNYFLLLRPRQWIKNLLVFVPVFFAQEFGLPNKLLAAGFAFAAFCFGASAAYIINDLLDAPRDRQHPTKRFRPLASGAVSVPSAIFILALLLIGGGAIGFWLVPGLLPVLAVYLALNVFYSGYGKHIPLLEMLLVAGFYLLRIVGGGLATGTLVSRWLVLCTVFVALFITIGKRRSELNGPNIRPVLKHYSNQFLDLLLTASLALTVAAYSIYCVLGTSSERLVYSVFFVLLGVFRYLGIILTSPNAEFPERVLYTDKIILGSVAGWVAFMAYSFYL